MTFPFPVSFFNQPSSGDFSYSETFGPDLFEWWRMDLGTTLDGNNNAATIEGQDKGIIFGNPDFGLGSHPNYVISSNLNNQPVLRWQDSNRNMQIAFGTNLIDEAVLLLVYYSPNLNTTGQIIVNGPIFGQSAGSYAVYVDTSVSQLRIRDLNSGNALFNGNNADWAGSHALIAEFDEINRGSIRRDGGADLKNSIQASYCETVSWNGMVFGPGIFGWSPEVGYELAEVAVLSAIPLPNAYNSWLNYISNRYALPVNPFI